MIFEGGSWERKENQDRALSRDRLPLLSIKLENGIHSGSEHRVTDGAIQL